jgi:Heparinase II/III-like protein/Heparinase II/III N-terminus
MVLILKKLKKLRGRSLEELRVRGWQEASALAEQAGVSNLTRLPEDGPFFQLFEDGRIPRPLSEESLLEHFRVRTSPHFFAAFDSPASTREELRTRFALNESRVLGRAHNILNGRFDLLGLKDLNFGSPINWQLEPVSGKCTPLAHWSRIDYLDPAVAGDKKVTWELNRHQYFQTLGRAYWYTGDERFAETFVTHASAWMTSNPPKLGINWASNLEVSFRLMSWLWALHFFRDSIHLAPSFFARLMKVIYLHARHLETYLSTYFSPNTHLTGEALGLFFVGTLFPEFREARRWRETGEHILFEQLDQQIRPDGVYFEQSTYYQRYTADFYLQFAILLQANGGPAPALLNIKLAALLDFLMHTTRPDGTTPLFGDDDGGRLAMLDDSAANDFRATLSTGATFLERGDYKFAAGGVREETLWLLGPDGLGRFDELETRIPGDTSRAFADGGYYVMRDGWRRDANFMMLDCGPHGAVKGAHAHADALSFDMSANGKTIIIDPGTYTYSGSQQLRDEFRSTAAHNALTIDGKSSSVSSGPFRWKQVARATARKWVNHERFDLFEGEHDGYERVAASSKYRRSVFFLKNDYWVIHDSFDATGKHACDLHFHFAPEVESSIENDGGQEWARTSFAGQPVCDLFTFGEGYWRRTDAWASSCYASRKAASACIYSTKGEGNQEFVSFLIPRAAHSARVLSREIEATQGRVFELGVDGHRDFVAIAEGGVVESDRIATDCAWAWVRFSRDDSTLPAEVVLIDGSFLRVDGQQIMRAMSRVERVVARRVGKEWYVESDTSDSLIIAMSDDSRVTLNGIQSWGRELTGAAQVRAE